MRTRPVLHEAEAKTYKIEATKFGLEGILASLQVFLIDTNRRWRSSSDEQ